MTQQKSLYETSKVLCRQADKLCRAAKIARLESKEAREASAIRRLLRKNFWALYRTANSLKLKIFLDCASYERLVNYVVRDAVSHAAINAAVLLGNTRVIDCDDVEARDLLVRARSHCPGAVDRLVEAIRAAGIII